VLLPPGSFVARPRAAACSACFRRWQATVSGCWGGGHCTDGVGGYGGAGAAPGEWRGGAGQRRGTCHHGRRQARRRAAALGCPEGTCPAACCCCCHCNGMVSMQLPVSCAAHLSLCVFAELVTVSHLRPMAGEAPRCTTGVSAAVWWSMMCILQCRLLRAAYDPGFHTSLCTALPARCAVLQQALRHRRFAAGDGGCAPGSGGAAQGGGAGGAGGGAQGGCRCCSAGQHRAPAGTAGGGSGPALMTVAGGGSVPHRTGWTLEAAFHNLRGWGKVLHVRSCAAAIGFSGPLPSSCYSGSFVPQQLHACTPFLQFSSCRTRHLVCNAAKGA
jgi:hypothetical protein